MALRDELLEDHWSYMDRYTAGMIARGPTLADDGDTPAGSVHIIDLSDPAPPGRSLSTTNTDVATGSVLVWSNDPRLCPAGLVLRTQAGGVVARAW
jgi:hypothetical protein